VGGASGAGGQAGRVTNAQYQDVSPRGKGQFFISFFAFVVFQYKTGVKLV
jgi:hypothetical protein